jgi:hypothetical protein
VYQNTPLSFFNNKLTYKLTMGNLITVKSKVPVDIIGIKVAFIRPMTKREHDFEGWKYDPKNRAYVIELENGVLLYPASNNEGDGPGALFGRNTAEKKNHQGFVLR